MPPVFSEERGRMVLCSTGLAHMVRASSEDGMNHGCGEGPATPAPYAGILGARESVRPCPYPRPLP